jgi:hypothetical protein
MKNAWDKKPSLIAPTRSDGDKAPKEAESFQNGKTKNRDVTHSFHRSNHSNRSESTGKRIQRGDGKFRVVQSTSDSTLRSLKNVPTSLVAINPQNLANNDQFPPLSTNSLATQCQTSQINLNLISSGWNVPKHQTGVSMQTSTAATTAATVSSETSVKKPSGSQINRIMGHDAYAIRDASYKNSKAEKMKQRHHTIQTEHYQSHKQTQARPRGDHPSVRSIPIHSQQHVENMLRVPQGITSIVKGKQKVKRKKSLSTLKKAILKERLEQYRYS